MTTQERLLKFEAENDDLSLRTSHLDCQIAIRRLLADLAAAREDVARDVARMEAIEHLKLTVQHRSGVTASVHPWMVRGEHGAWTGRSAREVIDSARAGGGR